MRRERLFYLDFIRAIAAVSIVITHFNARFLYLNPPVLDKGVITTTVSNVYIGDWGVSLFFIISGASLMYVYGEKCELKTFYKKRFLSIYPMFWMAYVLAFIYFVLVDHVAPGGGLPKWKFIFSAFGFDGLLVANGYPTCYLLGEWFLGVIILVYLLFPLLRKLLNEKPVLLIILAVISYAGGLVFCYCGSFPVSADTFIFVKIPEVVLGMFCGKYVRKIDWKAALAAAIVLVLNQILTPPLFSEVQVSPVIIDIRALYVGVSSFVVLAFLSGYLKNKVSERVCGVLSKYSYAVFLVHHVVIMEVTQRMDLMQISRMGCYGLFAGICCIIACLAWVLYILHAEVMKRIIEFRNKKMV